ncbi:hypothetical protein [Methylomagnum ishizawai]|uniref:hypothetical protein n=1 Tax=Methylomagnum ishizawai TaxID=1760988 RepID=UPI001C329CFF|nr:hypothetical protein [Methylomagnum ishizawai]BBL77514.1 hypothetical protein MishRS11D_46120 [Methylomagnum ishizawai]
MPPKGKKKPPSTADRLNTVLGLIASILGIFLTVSTLYGKSLELKDGDEKTKLELQKLRDSARESAPQIDIEYAELSNDLFISLSDSKKRQDRKQNLFLNYPVIPNEVVDENIAIKPVSLNPSTSPDGDGEQRVTFLVLKNKGKRDAKDVKVTFERLALSRTVRVNEEKGKATGDYIRQIKEKAEAYSQSEISIPYPIETNQGVLIPLFVTIYPYESQGKEWDVASKAVFLPKTLGFSDPLDGSVKSENIRQMRDPVRLESGLLERG